MTAEERFKTIEYKCPHCEETTRVENPEQLKSCKCSRFEWQRTDYFHGKKFVPKKLADELLTDYHVVTPANIPTPYYYDATVGYYKRAEHHLQQQIARRLKHDYTRNRDAETIAYTKATTYTHNHDEPEPNLINLANGTYNLQDDALLKHNPTNFFLNGLPVAHDDKADCPRVRAFLREITNTEADALALEEFAGYCLYRAMPKHRAFLLIGEGANGKSTYLNLLQKLLGNENHASVPLQDLITRPFLRARLYGKLANIFADLPSKALSGAGTGIFKALTGADSVDAEIKWVQDPINFTNYAKLIFSCNQIPRTSDDTDAFWRRWTLIRFPKQFKGDECDKELAAKLEAELPGFLNLALNGLKRLQNNKWEFSNERDEAATRIEYLKNSDSLKYFVETQIEITNSRDDFIEKDAFYSAYCDYVHQEKLGAPEAKNTVSKRLFELVPNVQTGRIKVEGERKTAWFGVVFRGGNDFDVGGKEEEKPLAQYYNGVEPLEKTGKGGKGGTVIPYLTCERKRKSKEEEGKTPATLATRATPDFHLVETIRVFFRRQGPELKKKDLEDSLELMGHSKDKINGTLSALIKKGDVTKPRAEFLRGSSEFIGGETN